MCMDGSNIIGFMAVTAVGGGTIFGTVGAVGLAKKLYNHIKDVKKSDSINNKIQSITAAFFAIGTGFALSIFSPTFIPIGLGIALGLNLPHIAKIFVKDKGTKEKLDNIAGTAGAIFNTLGLLPLLGLITIL